MADPKWDDTEGAAPTWDDTSALDHASRLESVVRGGIQGASAGFSDEIYGAGGSIIEGAKKLSVSDVVKDYITSRDGERERNRVARESNPNTYDASGIAGAVATSLIPVVGGAKAAAAMVKGASYLPKAITASRLALPVAQGAATGFGMSEADLTKGEVGGAAIDTAIGGGVGLAFGAAGNKISDKFAMRAARKAAQRDATAAGTAAVGEITHDIATEGAARATYNTIGGGTEKTATAIAAGARAADAEAVEAAARLLPGSPKVPPWVTTGDKLTQDAASTGLRSPSLGGSLVRREADPLLTSMRQAGEEILDGASTDLTEAQAGDAIRESLKTAFSKRLAPHAAEYEALEPTLRSIKPSAEKWGLTVDRLASDPRVKTNPEARAFLETMKNEFGNVDTLSALKGLRTSLRENSQRLGGTAKHVAGELSDALTATRDRALFDLPDGVQGATAMQRMRAADAGWRKSVEDISEAFGVDPKRIGVETALEDFLEAIPKENLSERLFSSKNVSKLEAFATRFPEQFQQVRQAELARLQARAMIRGEIDPSRLATQIGKMRPEVRRLLFGDKADMAQALLTVRNALPKEVNPSGTDVRGEIRNALSMNPQAQLEGMSVYLGSKGKSPLHMATKAVKSVQAVPAVAGRAFGSQRAQGAATRAATTFLNADQSGRAPESLINRARSSSQPANTAVNRTQSEKVSHFIRMQQDPEYRRANQGNEEP